MFATLQQAPTQVRVKKRYLVLFNLASGKSRKIDPLCSWFILISVAVHPCIIPGISRGAKVLWPWPFIAFSLAKAQKSGFHFYSLSLTHTFSPYRSGHRDKKNIWSKPYSPLNRETVREKSAKDCNRMPFPTLFSINMTKDTCMQLGLIMLYEIVIIKYIRKRCHI